MSDQIDDSDGQPEEMPTDALDQAIPFQAHSDTSREAAEQGRSKAPRDRAKCYAALIAAGPEGMTDEEMQQALNLDGSTALIAAGPEGMTDEEMQRALNLDGSTQRPRRIELMKAALVLDSGRRRPTSKGHLATVWVTQNALAAAS